MKRRSFLATTAAAAALPAPGAAAPARAKVSTEIKRLKLRHTWTTTMSSSDYRDTLHLALTAQGVTGRGEGAPIVRYHEDARSAQKAVESVTALLESCDPSQYT